MRYLDLFAGELAKESAAQPERLAFYIAAIAYPELEVERHLARLDQLAEEVGRALPAGAVGRERPAAFLAILTEQMGFSGNREDYYDPRNSFLNDLLDRRKGLPITLSLLCMALGRRLGMQVEGMGYPGHFMARYRDSAGTWVLDPANGEILAPAEVAAYLSQLFRQERTLADLSELVPVTPRLLARRMLNNLWGVYAGANQVAAAIRVLDYLLVLAPQEAALWQQRGILHYRAERLLDASRDLRRSLFLAGHTESLFAVMLGVEMEGWNLSGADEPTPESQERLPRAAASSAPAAVEAVEPVLHILQQITERLQRLN